MLERTTHGLQNCFHQNKPPSFFTDSLNSDTGELGTLLGETHTILQYNLNSANYQCLVLNSKVFFTLFNCYLPLSQFYHVLETNHLSGPSSLSMPFMNCRSELRPYPGKFYVTLLLTYFPNCFKIYSYDRVFSFAFKNVMLPFFKISD